MLYCRWWSRGVERAVTAGCYVRGGLRNHSRIKTGASSWTDSSSEHWVSSFTLITHLQYMRFVMCLLQFLTYVCLRAREREMFYLTTHSTHFIYGYMASDLWLRTILIVRKETRCRHIGYSYRLTARVLLYAPSHRQDNTYHGLCYTSRGALAGTRNSSMGPPHEGSIRRPIASWANALPLSYVPLRLRARGARCSSMAKHLFMEEQDVAPW